MKKCCNGFVCPISTANYRVQIIHNWFADHKKYTTNVWVVGCRHDNEMNCIAFKRTQNRILVRTLFDE